MERVSEKLPSVDGKVEEVIKLFLEEIDPIALEEGFEEGAGDQMYSALQEACNFYGEDYAAELASKLRSKLEGIEEYSQRVEEALEAILIFETDKGWD